MSKKRELFAVVDLETTGGLPKRDRIIEIGIVLSDGKAILDEFGSLIDPGRSIPPEITRITGITDDMVSGKPRFYELAKDIVQWTDGKIFVAHNVRFDYGFLQHAYRDLGYTYTRKLLCTMRLSRALYPQFRTHSLGALIERYDLQVDSRHRAMDDARATAKLLNFWMDEQAVTGKVYDLINLGVKEAKLPSGISLEQLHSLPDETGVYYFYDHSGELIYIGKANDIRARVMQHFTPQSSKAEKLQRHVAEIQFEITGSEIAALLKESLEIKKLKPEFNKVQRNSSFPYAIALDTSSEDGIHRLRVTHIAKVPDQSIMVGRYPTKNTAYGIMRSKLREFELCFETNEGKNNGQHCKEAQLQICRGICANEEAVLSYNERLREAADTLVRVFDQDFIYVEDGRESGEYFVVLVEEGVISSTGYISDEFSTAFPELVKEQLSMFNGTAEETRILWSYLKRRKKPKLFYLNR